MEMGAARTVLRDRELGARLANHSPSNGGGTDGLRFAEAALAWSHAVGMLAEWGVILRDLDGGLCDFPSDRHGEPIALSWKLGEPTVTYWHHPEDAAGGRRPLDSGIA